jgi:hypothetical protein
MRTLRLAALAALCVGCHFDKLFNASGGGGGPAPTAASTPSGLTFSAQPQSTTQNTAIAPPVQVTAIDSTGNAVLSFTGSVFIAVGQDGSVQQDAKLTGFTRVSAVNGVATFADLRIDQVGVGYTLTAAIDSGLPLKESGQFNVTPTVP